MDSRGLHWAQRSILTHLRHNPEARFSELLHTTDMTGDTFKFHIQKLIKLEYISKAHNGLYTLTPRGKEFANSLDEQTGGKIDSPKTSMLIVVRSRVDGTDYYLAHRRRREPFRGFWGLISGPLIRGVLPREAASYELQKQTGIVADFNVVGFYRVIDKSKSGGILEDKLFTVLFTKVNSRPVSHAWHAGEARWYTKEQLTALAPLFPQTLPALDIVEGVTTYAEDICAYDVSEY